MSSIAPIALSVAFRAVVLTFVQGNGVLTGLLLGCWDGAFIHHAWIKDRALEPLTLLQIICGTCFDLSHRPNVTNLAFIVLGGLLGALLSDTGLLGSSFIHPKGVSLDIDLDDIADAFSGLLPSIKEEYVDYESDSSSSSSITIIATSRHGRDSQRPSTRLSNYSRLTGLTSKSAQSRSLSSLPRLTIPEKRKSGLPILTLGSSDPGELTPKAGKLPPIPQSWLPASGSFIPRTYSVSSAQSATLHSRQHRPKSNFGEDRAEHMRMHVFDDDDLPPRSSFVRPRDLAHVSQAESISAGSSVPEIQVVPPDESLPAFSPGMGYEMPRSPSNSEHHSQAKTPSVVYAQNMSTTRDNVSGARSPSIRNPLSHIGDRPGTPAHEHDVALPPPSPVRTTVSIRTIRTDDGTPIKTVINVVPTPLQQTEDVMPGHEAVPVPGSSHARVDTRDDEPVDEADYISEPTAPESVVSFAPRNAVLLKADRYRQEARQALDRRYQLQKLKERAEREKRWADAFSLKFQIGEQEELANKLNAKAERRYHAGTPPSTS